MLLLLLQLPLPLLLHLYCMVLQTIYSLVSFSIADQDAYAEAHVRLSNDQEAARLLILGSDDSCGKRDM